MSIDRAKALKSAQKHMAKGQLDRAIADYEKVVALEPKDPRSLLKLGDLYTRVGDSRNAVQTYRKVAIQYGADGFFLKAVAVYKQILKLEPENLDAWAKLGEMYEALSLTSDAIATFEQVAESAQRAGRQDIALRALERISALEPENVAAVIRHAESLSKADRIDEAIVAFRHGADLLKRQGRIDDFVKVTERLLFHSHEDIDRARELAALYLERDKVKQALSHLQTCFKHDSKDASTLSLLARAFEGLGQSAKAVSVLRELARVHASTGQAHDELQALQRLLAIDPGNTDAVRRVEALASGDEDIVVDESSSVSQMGEVAHASTAELTRLLAELEVFERYNLRDQMRAQLERLVSLAPGRTDLRDRLEALGGSATPTQHSVPEQDEQVLVVDEDDDSVSLTDEADFSDVRPSSLAPVDDDDEPELVLDEEPADAEELDLTDDDVIESESIEPEAPQPLAASMHPRGPTPQPSAPGEPNEKVPDRVAEALEEADFYTSQGLLEEAREVLFDALGDYPSHPALIARLRVLDDAEEQALAADEAATTEVAKPSAHAASTSDDRSFALAEKLAAEAVDAANAGPQGPVDVADLLAQFKAGVDKQIPKSDSATHYDLGIAYMEMGFHGEAIEEFKLCLATPGKECTAHTMIGLSYVSKGEMDAAITHFKLALESPGLRPDAELDLWFEIGNAHELCGRASEALVWYEKVEERKPEFRDVAARIERLGVVKTPRQETDEFEEMFDNLIIKE